MIQALKRLLRPRVLAANSASQIADFDTAEAWFSNEITNEHGTGGWALLAPYGKWPHPKGLQIVNRESMMTLVSNFQKGITSNNPLLNIVRRTRGLPFYIGHPDDPESGHLFPNEAATGRIKELEAREDGLWGRVKWNATGRKIIEEEEYDGHSVNWHIVRDPNGRGITPDILVSVGWTNRPRIPVPAITTANSNEERQIMLDWLKTILGLKAETTEDEIKTQAAAVCNDAKLYRDIVNATKLDKEEDRQAFANAHKDDPIIAQIVRVEKELIDLRGKLATAETTAANAKTAGADLQTKLTATETALTESRAANTTAAASLVTAQTEAANERKAHAANLVEIGFKDSRITPATKAQWEAEFVSNFAATVTKFKAAKPTLHTSSVVNEERAKRQATLSNGIARTERIKILVKEKMATGFDYATAFNLVSAEHPELATA